MEITKSLSTVGLKKWWRMTYGWAVETERGIGLMFVPVLWRIIRLCLVIF